MKILLIVLIAFMIGCKSKKTTTTVPFKDTTKQVCDFGIQEFNQTARVLTPEEEFATVSKKPRQPPRPKPGASTAGVILLDFDGHYLTGTSWNYAGDINCYPAALTLDERQRVLDTVAKRFQGFNLIVTSDEATYNAAPLNKRIRVILTDTHEWFGAAGGVAFIGSFTWGDNTPCFVFTKALAYNIKKIQEAATHEPGHAIGLYHQSSYDTACNRTNEYNYGANGEAPIMGIAYQQPYAHWWVGPTPYGCTEIQNDTLIIRSVTK